MKTKKAGRPPKHGKPMKKIEARVEDEVLAGLKKIKRGERSEVVNKILKDFFKGDKK